MKLNRHQKIGWITENGRYVFAPYLSYWHIWEELSDGKRKPIKDFKTLKECKEYLIEHRRWECIR